MIRSARFPNSETTVSMDAHEQHLNEDPTPEPGEGSSGSPIAAARNTEPDSASRRLEHPMQAILGAVVVLLLGFALTQTNDRVSRLEDRAGTGFAKVDERFARQDAKLDEINLKLTALSAALNATAEVDAALEGSLLGPSAAPRRQPGKLTPAPIL